MKVQVWSDFRCSFCYIGKRYIEKAFEELGKPLELELMSYELDPDFIPVPGVSHHDKIAESRGMSSEQQKALFDRIADMATSVGLRYDVKKMVDANSFKAHKVLQYAKQEGKETLYSDKVFAAHFELGLYIASDEVLIALAQEAGLDKQKVKEILSGSDFEYEVRQQEMMARQMEVSGVPFFILDDKVSLSGAQPIEVMKQAIAYTEKLANEGGTNE